MALLQRCADVIGGEVVLLDAWRSSGAMSAAGKADCRSSIEHISIGDTSAKVIVDNIIDKAKALSDTDVTSVPSDAALDFVKNLEQNLKTRSEWDGPDLEQLWLESALAQAKDNAEHAADSASGILRDCTG